jgi:putative transcriptional regulator
VTLPVFVWGGAAAVGLSVLLAVSAPVGGVAEPGTVSAGQLRRGTVRQLAPGKLLVAARNLPDPNFGEAVVLLVDVNAQGAVGIIVNRPTEATLTEILPGLEHTTGNGTAYFGGPVQVSGVLALLRSERTRTDCRKVFGDVYLVTTRSVLDEMLGTGAGPTRFRVYVGYAGWGAGQLQGEAAQGAWHVLDGDPDVVFDPEPDSVWQRQIRRTEDLRAQNPAREPLASP